MAEKVNENKISITYDQQSKFAELCHASGVSFGEGVSLLICDALAKKRLPKYERKKKA